MAGYRNKENASVNNLGTYGNYWSSSPNGENARRFRFNSSDANFNNSNRANGFAVRCFSIPTSKDF